MKAILFLRQKWTKYLKMVDGWEVKADESEIYYLIKEFKFKNFLESQEFVNKVGNIAEKEGHHPDIWFGWGYAKIKSLSCNPLIA